MRNLNVTVTCHPWAMKTLLRLRALAIVTLPLLAATKIWASAGTEGASFLDIPVGAGPAAMGSAYTALATNAYAPTWNAGAMGFVNGNEMAFQHLSYLEGIHYEYLSFVHPLSKGRDSGRTHSIGFSAQYLGSGDIAGTDANGNAIGDFSSRYGSYNLAWGMTLSQKLGIGVTGKLINAKIDDVSANAYATDLGALYKATEKVQVGATILNVGSKLKFINEGDSLPTALRIGGAYKHSSRLLASMEGVYRKNGLASFHAGGQWRPIETISLRVGYKTDTLEGLSAIAGLTTGIGLHLWGQEFAYAWAPYGDLGNAQYFSMLIKFGAREEERRNLIQYNKIKKHRTVQSGPKKDEIEPEYQQLMQLLSEQDIMTAQKASEDLLQ